MVRVSDHVGAFLANCDLAEYGIITLKNTFHTIDCTKLRRQMIFCGKNTASMKKGRAKRPSGLYTDGLHPQPSLGKRRWPLGRGATREVSSTSNDVEVMDDFPILGMPGAEYVTHVTPENRSGVTLAKELEATML